VAAVIYRQKKPWFVRISILTALLVVWFFTHALFQQLEQRYSQPVTLTFSLPIPDDTAKIFGVPTKPDVDKVIVSGFFSDWAEDSPYTMTQKTPDTWTIDIELPPGNNQYKFVVYLKNKKEPVWVYDVNNPNILFDTWGEHNSIINIPDISPYRFAVNALLTGITILFFISFFIEPIIYRILHWRLAFHFKLMISMVMFITVSNSLFMMHNLHESRQLVKQGIIDNINLVHLVLSGKHINFKNLHQEGDSLRKSLSEFFWDSKSRVEKHQLSPYQITLSDLAILDRDYKLVALSHRTQNNLLQQQRAQKFGFKNSEEFFMQYIFEPAIAKSKKNVRIEDTIFSNPVKNITDLESIETRRNNFFIGYSTFLKPIIIQGRHVGFYAGTIENKLYGKEIERIFYTSLVLIIIVSAICLFLLASVGKLITHYLTELTVWAQQIIKGNFDTRVTIKSGDEIQLLAENFDIMRISLEESFSQIAEKNQLLLRDAYYDVLTNLPNRKKMFLDLENQNSKSLIVINIDSFRGLNDFFGTDVGDSVLKEVSLRLVALTESYGLHLYKIGPDEFVISIGNISYPIDIYSNEQLQQFTQRTCKKITESCYNIGGNEIYISVTAGIAVDAESIPAKLLFSHAANAMRMAKEKLLGQLLYDKSMEETQAFEYNMTLASKIKQAIDEDRIVPYFQPIVTNGSGEIEKYECLVRMIEKDGNIIGPHQFLTIAEQARLYPFITQIMIKKSFAMFANTHYEFSINLSIDDILNTQTIHCLFATIEQYPFAATRAVFEMTESAEIQNYEILRQFISKVKNFGCRIAIDDFGSGYSNFAHIMSMKIDYLKIDGSLIRNLDTDNNAQIISRTIAEFAKTLGIKTIAEFVHSEVIYAKTLEYGIDFSQGYYFGKPEPTLVENSSALKSKSSEK